MNDAHQPLLAIRKAYPAEADSLTALARAAKAHWPYSGEQLARWRDLITVNAEDIATHPTWVAELDGAPAGFYRLKNTEGWSLHDLWVSPDCMRRGVGGLLFGHAMALAREGGAAAVAIDAEPYAESFYLAQGAVRVGQVVAAIEADPYRVRPQLVYTF